MSASDSSKPQGWPDEEWESAYVTVTAETLTADDARGWLVKNAADVLGNSFRLNGQHTLLRALAVKLPDAYTLPSHVDVEAHVAAGGLAWWEFDISTALKEVLDAQF
jgi:hypothetical protein